MYDEILAEFKRIAEKMDLTIITPKARPMTEREKLEYDAYMADPNRFIDYTGIIR